MAVSNALLSELTKSEIPVCLARAKHNVDSPDFLQLADKMTLGRATAKWLSASYIS